MRRILFIIPNIFVAVQNGGGGERHLARLASEVEKTGDQAQIISYKRGWHLPHHETVQIDQQVRDVLVLPIPNIRLVGTLIFIFCLTLYFLRHLFSRPIVILNSVHAYVMLIGWIARLTGKATIGYTLFGDLIVLQKRKGILRALHCFLIRQQSYIIPLSKEMDQILKDAGIPAQNRVIIPNGIDTEHYKPLADAQERTQLRETLHLPVDRYLIIMVARFAPVKRHNLMLDALALLKAQHPQATLVLVGDGSLRPELEAQVQRLGITNNVIFQGYTDSVPAFLQAVDAFALPSDSEGHSNALVEAMAVALPIVGTQVSGTVDSIVPDVNGILVPRGDVQALVNAFDYLICNPDRAKQIGAKARDSVIEHYSLQDEMRKYQKLLRNF